jgi:hypothetical protein
VAKLCVHENSLYVIKHGKNIQMMRYEGIKNYKRSDIIHALKKRASNSLRLDDVSTVWIFCFFNIDFF